MAILKSRTAPSFFASVSLLIAAHMSVAPAFAEGAASPQGRVDVAQLFSRPPAAVGDDGYGSGGGGGADSAQLLLRIDRLENQVRSLNGQIEQLQFSQRRLEDQLKKFQQDVDFRFQDAAGGRGGALPPPPVPRTPQKRSDADTNAAANADFAAAAPPVIDPPVVAAANGRRRGDAFDPASDPTAPGAPRSLGQVASTGGADPQVITGTGPLPSGPLGGGRDPNAPLDLTTPAGRSAYPSAAAPPVPTTPRQPSSLGARPIGLAPPGTPASAALAPGAPPVVGNVAPASPGPATTPGGTVLAGLPPAATAGTKEEFDLALVSLNNGQFEAAETGFRGFLEKHPKDRLVPDAVFYLGDSYWKRGRAREAAEQYLKVSTDFSKSARAPESLVRLGLALEKLGAKEQACATLGEVSRKYPTASVSVRNSAGRESKRLAC